MVWSERDEEIEGSGSQEKGRTHLSKLPTLEAIQQNLANALLEVDLHASTELLKHIKIRTTETATPLLLIIVAVDNEVGGRLARQGNQQQRFRDILPVVNEERLQVVGDGDADGGPEMECLFLWVKIWVSECLNGGSWVEFGKGGEGWSGEVSVLGVEVLYGLPDNSEGNAFGRAIANGYLWHVWFGGECWLGSVFTWGAVRGRLDIQVVGLSDVEVLLSDRARQV